MNHTIYLDYAAATPLDDQVLAAMQPYFQESFYNPSAEYLAAKEVAQVLSDARATVASNIGARPTEVIFTAGGTEANNLAIQGVMHLHKGTNIVVSAIEHPAVLVPAGEYDVRQVPVSAEGIVDVEQLAGAIDDKTSLVSIMYANNEVGTVQPIREISRLIATVRADRQRMGNVLPIYLHTDACQAAAWLDLHVHRLGVDLMTLNAGKIYGPKQTGALFVKTGTRLQPQILGGGQERGQRSGTENVANIVGFARAIELVQAGRRDETARMKQLQTMFIDGLCKAIPGVQINGSLKHRLPNNVHVTFPGVDNERLMMQLDEKGILCAVGSACSASSGEPSHVLKALGISEEDAQSSLRFTMGKMTTTADIARTVAALAELVGA